MIRIKVILAVIGIKIGHVYMIRIKVILAMCM